MYYMKEGYARVRIEDSALAIALLRDYLPGWRAALYEHPRFHWDLNRSFAWKLAYPADGIPDMVQVTEETVEIAPITSVLHAESQRVTLRLLERLQATAIDLAGRLPERGWKKVNGLWLMPEEVRRREQVPMTLADAHAAAAGGNMAAALRFLEYYQQQQAVQRQALSRLGGPLPAAVWRTRDPEPPASREDIFANHLIDLGRRHSA